MFRKVLQSDRVLRAFALLGLLSTLAAAQSDAGQKLWRSCAACHCVPDLRIAGDHDWLRLIPTTTCISGENDRPELRQALLRYLKAEGTLRPVLVDAKHPASTASVGVLRLPATGGSAYLKADRASVRKGSPSRLRVAWEASEKGRAMKIPAGSYRVISYSFQRKDAKGRAWAVAGSSAQGCVALTVERETTTEYEILPCIHGNLSAKRIEGKEQRFEFGFFMTSCSGGRISLARDGRLVNPTWVVIDAKKKPVSEGAFQVT